MRIQLNLQVGPYEWITYEEAYDAAIRIGSAMRSRAVNPVILALLRHYTMYLSNLCNSSN